MARRKKQLWQQDDIFTIPMLDGSFAVGQVLERHPKVLNSVICRFFSTRISEPMPLNSIELGDVISCQFTTPDNLDTGRWQVIGRGCESSSSIYFDLDALEKEGYLGVKVIGSGIIEKLMNAYFSLYPWDGFYKPDYLDKLLISQDKKPSKLMLQNK